MRVDRVVANCCVLEQDALDKGPESFFEQLVVVTRIGNKEVVGRFWTFLIISGKSLPGQLSPLHLVVSRKKM